MTNITPIYLIQLRVNQLTIVYQLYVTDFLNLQARAAARYGFLFGGPFLCADWLKSSAQITWNLSEKSCRRRDTTDPVSLVAFLHNRYTTLIHYKYNIIHQLFLFCVLTHWWQYYFLYFLVLELKRQETLDPSPTYPGQ